MRCLAVVKFATEELTTAKYGCSDQRERNRILRVSRCWAVFLIQFKRWFYNITNFLASNRFARAIIKTCSAGVDKEEPITI